MIKTGIFGGSFNPIHNGHIALAKHILSLAGLDEIWFVVSPQNPFKSTDSDLLADHFRLELTRLALADEPHLVANDYEFHLPKPSYMWHTLQAMSYDYPNRTFTLLIGADNWMRFSHWYHADDIIAHYPIVIYPRQGAPIDTATLPPNVRLVDTPLYNISSTEIRRRIRTGTPVDTLLPPSILRKVQKYYHSNTKFSS
jgi:nicotinate-nucleotide adenylyltransferase